MSDLVDAVHLVAAASRKATEDASDSTIEDHRNKRTNAYAAAVLALWKRYQAGDLTADEFDAEMQTLAANVGQEVVDHFAAEVGVDADALSSGRAEPHLASFTDAALAAAAVGLVLFAPDAEPPSDALAALRADQAAGPTWALHWQIEYDADATALEGGLGDAFDESLMEGDWVSTGDDRVCDSCDALETGSPYPANDMPTLPGAGDTECQGACRCEVNYSYDGEEMDAAMLADVIAQNETANSPGSLGA